MLSKKITTNFNGPNNVCPFLGPIGSKKPTSPWGSSSLAPHKPYGYPAPGFMDLQPEPEGLLETEETLALDPEDRWEDQHALMQMMHATTQPTWKGKTE